MTSPSRPSDIGSPSGYSYVTQGGDATVMGGSIPGDPEGQRGPKVSVCIPSYNHGKYIGACIESVLAQIFDDWEMVIVDNSSSDNTQEVVRDFADPRIRFYKNETNIGVARNWNRCGSFARGEYVGFLQSDDQYLPRMLDRSVAFLDARPRVGFTHSSFHRIDSDGNFIDSMSRWGHDHEMDGLTALRQLAMSCYITPSTVVMRRAWFNDVGGFDESFRYNIDWSMWMRLSLFSDVGYIAEPLVRQRTGHPGSVTMSSLIRSPHVGTLEEIRLIDEIFRRLQPPKKWREARRQAHRNIMHRHIMKALWLLHHGETALFRSEMAHAIRLNPSFPFQYRKMMALWGASAFGEKFAKWLDVQEEDFWQVLHARPRIQGIVAP